MVWFHLMGRLELSAHVSLRPLLFRVAGFLCAQNSLDLLSRMVINSLAYLTPVNINRPESR